MIFKKDTEIIIKIYKLDFIKVNTRSSKDIIKKWIDKLDIVRKYFQNMCLPEDLYI